MVAYEITSAGEHEASKFVVFIIYISQVSGTSIFLHRRTGLSVWMQLYSPLNQLGYLYRSINQSLVDTEKLLALLNEPTEVNDKPNAPDLIVQDGEIEFGSFPHLLRIYNVLIF